MKITTPRGIGLIVSLILAILSVLFNLFADWYYESDTSPFGIFLDAIVILAASYFLVYFFVDRFIDSRVKNIYKTIHSKKINKKTNELIGRSDDTLSEASTEVSAWVNDRQMEIEKLKTQEQFRREFLGNLAHELKTPIFSIQGYILTLLEGGLEDPGINRNFLERAAKGVERITHIIEDLDTITQLESGKLHLNKTKTNIIELTREVMESLEIHASVRAIKLGFDYNYDKPLMVYCDKGRIAQVLSNLLINSIHYGKEKGRTEVRFLDMDDKILVEVADNGPGIPEANLPRIFERFYRVDKSRARQQGGSGLGLSIVKHILEAHGQSIHVRSTEEEGTAFSFTLEKYS